MKFGSLYAMQVKFGSDNVMRVNFWGLSTLCWSIFGVRLRYAGQFLGSVYVLQVKSGVCLRYAGEIWSVNALHVKFGVCARSTGEIWG